MKSPQFCTFSWDKDNTITLSKWHEVQGTLGAIHYHVICVSYNMLSLVSLPLFWSLPMACIILSGLSNCLPCRLRGWSGECGRGNAFAACMLKTLTRKCPQHRRHSIYYQAKVLHLSLICIMWGSVSQPWGQDPTTFCTKKNWTRLIEVLCIRTDAGIQTRKT